MEFKQLTIENFLCYYTKTTFDFSSGTTVILGQNNTGKSKLFDAINWCIYERVYDTLKEKWITDVPEISKLILNKRKNIEGQLNKENIIKTNSELIIEDGCEQITINREYSYILKDDNYSFANSKISVSVQDMTNSNFHFSEGVDATGFLAQKFSKNIQDFFLFQGESGSKILKLQKGNFFKTAVRDIARLGIFENALDFAEKFETSAKLKITKQLNKSKQTKQEIENLEVAVNKLENEIQELKEEKEQCLKTRNQCQDEFDNISSKLDSMKEFESFMQDKKILEENRKTIEIQQKNAESIKTTISEEAVFYKIVAKISSFKDFYHNLQQEGKVPPVIPISEIKKSLNSPTKRCPICNGDLSEGTEGRKFAESCLPHYDADKLGNFLREINSAMYDYDDDIIKIPEKLNLKLEEKKRIESTKIGFVQQLKQLDEQLNNINITNQSDEQKKQELDELKSKYRSKNTLLERAKADFFITEGKLASVQKTLDRERSDLNSKICGADDDIEENDKIALTYAVKILTAMKKLNEIVQKKTYEEIENRANDYYHEMTDKNASLVGKLKIDIENSDIYTVDDNGNKIQNINQANRISIQIAVIAGILTIAEEQFDIQYPFVTDAPVSALGGDNKAPTIQTIINAFEQSIIILKDDSNELTKNNDEIRQMINSSKDIEIAYELKTQEAPSINEQYTIVQRIK